MLTASHDQPGYSILCGVQLILGLVSEIWHIRPLLQNLILKTLMSTLNLETLRPKANFQRL